MRIILTSILILVASFAGAQSPFSATVTTIVKGGVQDKGLVTLDVEGKAVTKRYVVRIPAKWNGSLVIGAHGGSGGDAIDRSGKVYGTSETALDDVIGDYAFTNGFAYASVDRDGIGGTRSGYSLTMEFQASMHGEVTRLGRGTPLRTYIVGLSAGGGITRMIAEGMPTPFDGALIIAGAGGDVITRMDRQQRMAALWPLIDPRSHAGLSNKDPRIVSYAEAIGTPVEARRLWPYTGSSAGGAARPQGTVENSTAKPSIPTIEVVGTWDDLVIREIRAYRDRVEPKERHRLYQVEGVWHMSGDDDGVQGFQYAAETRMKLDKDVADAMGLGPSYIPTVREAFDYLVRWTEKGVPPPSSQTVAPSGKLR
ncbi:MAG TPA: alpha/beta hydrolase domain-containing protein [Vicinamibacterales bacterium]|nr:alpha/beta hydrolase domain-containing protein [Vicinamibacterales bacterium]